MEPLVRFEAHQANGGTRYRFLKGDVAHGDPCLDEAEGEFTAELTLAYTCTGGNCDEFPWADPMEHGGQRSPWVWDALGCIECLNALPDVIG